MACHYWYFNHGFKFQNFICNGCHDLTMLCLNLSDIAIITVKNIDYRLFFMKLANLKQFIFQKIMYLKTVGIYKMHSNKISIKNRVHNYHFDNLVRAKKLETKNILIDEKNYKDNLYYQICSQQVNKNAQSVLS